MHNITYETQLTESLMIFNTLELAYININFVENHEELWHVTWTTNRF